MGTKPAFALLVLLFGRGLTADPSLDQNAAYSLLNQRVGVNRANFYVYQDADSGLNHGFPSGFFGTISKLHLNAACLDDPLEPGGCSTDGTRLDRVRGNVLSISFDPLTSGQFAGINIEDPEFWGVNRSGVGYDLRGATAVVFDVRSPTPGGIQVQFGVADRAGGYVFIPQSQTFTTMTIPLASMGVDSALLSDTHVLFQVATNDVHAPGGGTVLLDNVRFTPTPAAQSAALSFPVGSQTFGVVPSSTIDPGRVPIPPDQVSRNLTTIYESALTLMILLDRGTAADLSSARVIADTFHYALSHDNHGLPLPAAPDGSVGLHSGYESGDIQLLNNQTGGGAGLAGDVRLAGFSVGSNLCGPSKFCLVLDGATGGNEAFAMLALLAAYHKLGDSRYLDDARTIGRWIAGNLTDTTGTGYGGYYLGYPDEGKPKTLVTGKSIENNADIFAAFAALASVEQSLGNTADAGTWTTRANGAGDFVMSLFEPVSGRFYAGTVPAGTPASPGIAPNGPQQGNDVINTFDFLDSNTFTVLALAGSSRYRNQIDWRRPVQWFLDQAVSVTANGAQYDGFSIVPTPTAGPAGVAWEFTGQAVATMRFVDALYQQTTFGALADSYANQIASAQGTAPFGDGEGVVASTMEDGDLLPPIEQCLSTPFQCIPERVGLAATTWAILAARHDNPLVVPPPPIAVADLYAPADNAPLTIPAPGVLGNDTLNRATIAGYGAATGTEQTTIGNPTPTVQGGSVALNADGGFTYTAPPGPAGVDTFKYKVTSIGGGSTATVTIRAIRRGDLNGDAKSDILWRHSGTGQNYLWLMDSFIVSSQGTINVISDSNWKVAGQADFDADGKTDILWRHAVDGSNYMYLMNGLSIGAAGYVNIVPDLNWQIAGVGDYDGDGNGDVLWRNLSTGENYLYLMNGLSIRATGYLRGVPDTNWKIAGSGDLNGDGKADVVWRHSTTGQTDAWLVNGFTITGEGTVTTIVDSNWKVAAVSDFDGDGRADLFWRNDTTGENYLYRMSGTSTLAQGYINIVADLGWKVAAAADYNGDGKTDILWRHAVTGDNYIYMMDGFAIAAAGYAPQVSDAAWKVVP